MIPLRAGPLTLEFDPDSGGLRRIRLGAVEVVRGIYAAVRDRNWDTVAPALRDLEVAQGPETFAIDFRAEHVAGPVDFAWLGSIRGEADGTVRYTFDGRARSTFLRNRIGFCVLHPIRECAGRPCTIEGVDGRAGPAEFPAAISPHQPFKDVHAITHEVAPGLQAEVRFEGDVFETEDQRNWTDASFKTYCTPLDLPFPVELPEGADVAQSVTVRLIGTPPPQAEAGAWDWPRIAVGREPIGPLPRLGLGFSDPGRALTDRELGRLKDLNPAHLRVDLDPGRADLGATLRRAAEVARAVGCGLEVALTLGGDLERELEAMARAAASIRPPVTAWLVFRRGEKSTSAATVEAARRHLAGLVPGALLVAGTDFYFAELNRGGPPSPAADAVCYSINPQVHAFDDASLIETLEAQGATVADARRIGEGRPVVVSPVTLRPRSNPNATGPEPEIPPDPRQATPFAAAWTLGSLKALAEAGAASATYFEALGPRGVMADDESGNVHPMFRVLEDLSEFAGGDVLPVTVEPPGPLAALAVGRDGRRRLLVAHLGPEKSYAHVAVGPVGASLAYHSELPVAAPEPAVDGTVLLVLHGPEVVRVDLPPEENK